MNCTETVFQRNFVKRCSVKLHKIYYCSFASANFFRSYSLENLRTSYLRPANLVTFTEEILNGKLQFLFSVVKEDYSYILRVIACSRKIIYSFLLNTVSVTVISATCDKELVSQKCTGKKCSIKFAKFKRKYHCLNLFLKKFQAAGCNFGILLKRDSCTDVFLWFLNNFSEQLFPQHLGMVVSKYDDDDNGDSNDGDGLLL